MTDNNTKHIVDFLQNLIISIQNKNINKTDMLEVINFYTSYKCKNINKCEDKDIQAYLFLGYYIYNHILNEHI
jgi:hypothetical protein